MQTKIPQLARDEGWRNADDGWQGVEGKVRLQGWTREKLILQEEDAGTGQIRLSGVETVQGKELFEYAVLVTTLQSKDLLMLSQLYRDRADAENIFDELKNQWGWTGFTTRDKKRSQLMARIVALIFNWWSLYSRLALPNKHAEAITSRPLFLHGVARMTSHGGQSKLTITSNHGKADSAMQALSGISDLLREIGRAHV